MESNGVLVQAASGLEKLMVGTSSKGVLKDSMVAQISAAVYYQAKVVSKLTTNKEFQQKFSTVVFNQIDKDFGEYIDALARSNPKSLHHVYEWKQIGKKSARLFKLSKISQSGLSFKIGYELLPSKTFVPSSNSKRRHVFANKAMIMEQGRPLTIRPKFASRLVFEMNGLTVFMPKGQSVTVNRPGGASVKNQFTLRHSRFFRGQLVNNSIKRSGFQQIFNTSMKKALRLPSDVKKVKYSFSANTLDMQADAAIAAAFGGIV